MSILKDSNNTSIYGGNYVAGPQHVYNLSNNKKSASDTLRDNVAWGAMHDSSTRFDPPKCHPETRTAVLNCIDQWLQDTENKQPVLWLSGPAGAGKSAIAQTLAERWKASGQLLGSFFFSRTVAQRNVKAWLIPTLAYQLSLSRPDTWPYLQGVISSDIGIFQKTLGVELAELVLAPLQQKLSLGDPPLVFIIDGLDECCQFYHDQPHESQQAEILDALASAGQKMPNIRFLVASRPERQIRQRFQTLPLQPLAFAVNLSDAKEWKSDIRLYLRSKFKELSFEHPYLGPNWPTDVQIDQLVEKSSGQFIYPACVVRYVSRPRESPSVNLEKVLNLRSHNRKTSKDSPLAELDALYTLILETVSPASSKIIHDVLSIRCLEKFRYYDGEPWDIFTDPQSPSPYFFEKYLFLPPGEIYVHLTDLHSILSMPSLDEQRPTIYFFHATFPEFLQDQSRSGKFFTEPGQYLIHRQLLLLKHAKNASIDRGYGYKGEGLARYILAWALREYPPDAELSTELHKFVQKEIDRCQAEAKQVKSDSQGPFDDLRPEELGWIVDYLRTCNILINEPSAVRRSSLKRQIATWAKQIQAIISASPKKHYREYVSRSSRSTL